MDLDVGELHVVHKMGWRIVDEKENLPVLTLKHLSDLCKINTPISRVKRLQSYLQSFVNIDNVTG